MKKLFLFAIMIIAIGFVSCQKQSISDSLVGNYLVTVTRSYANSSQQTIIDTLPSYTMSINKQGASTVGINNFIPTSNGLGGSFACPTFFIGYVSKSLIVLDDPSLCTENMIITREGDNLNFTYEKLFTYSGTAIKQ